MNLPVLEIKFRLIRSQVIQSVAITMITQAVINMEPIQKNPIRNHLWFLQNFLQKWNYIHFLFVIVLLLETISQCVSNFSIRSQWKSGRLFVETFWFGSYRNMNFSLFYSILDLKRQFQQIVTVFMQMYLCMYWITIWKFQIFCVT